MWNRIRLITLRDCFLYLRRPMLWVWIFLAGFMYFGLSQGNVRIGTGGSSQIGGVKQWLTSEFEVARLTAALNLLFTNFFVAILAGMSVIRDDETRISPLLHSSPLKPWEYLTGKSLGWLGAIGAVLAVNLCSQLLFMHAFPAADRVAEYHGPLEVGNYLRPLLLFTVPTVLLIGGLSFSIGTVWRKPVLVFVFPTVCLIVCGLFLQGWAPMWLPPWADRLLMCIDPFGNRWLSRVWFDVDRGAEFYNTNSIGLDGDFLMSRIAMMAVGIGAIVFSERRFTRRLRGQKHGALTAASEAAMRDHTLPQRAFQGSVLATLRMSQKPTSWFVETWHIVRYELRELVHSPSLYLFAPFILIEAIGSTMFSEGVFGTSILHTSGGLAVECMNTLMLLGCLLLMFYTVESQLRERTKKMSSIFYATPSRSFSMLFGKTLANSGVCMIIMLVTAIACLAVQLYEGQVEFKVFPFVLVWGCLLLPTYIVWSAYVTLIVVIVRNRYLTYAAGAAVLFATFYFQFTGDIDWVTNWNLWSAVQWSDISTFEKDRIALILNRSLYLSLAVLFTYLASRFFWRRSVDAVQVATRLRPWNLLKFGLRCAPFAAAPLVLALVLSDHVSSGHQGSIVEKQGKDYWSQNLQTWKDAPQPSLAGIEADIDIDPATHGLAVNGTMQLLNDSGEDISKFALTVGSHWRNVKWTLAGREYEPENRSGLWIFEPNETLRERDIIEIGYKFSGRYPDGVSENGGEEMEFILPSGVVMTSFRPTFVPLIGFVDGVGVDEDNETEPKRYRRDFYEDELKPLFGAGDHFDVKLSITGPKGYTFNGVGVKLSDTVNGDNRTVVWQSDSPVSFFNIVGGRYKVHEGKGTQIYYDREHDYNVEEIGAALDGARQYYSRWFAPYPWKELRLSEFPAMSSYAQGFPSNISFSESIGFLTRDEPGADAPFMVAAHEAAHQWWGNILVPGKGPGGNILSEGMAHFSTGLLFDQVKGERARISFFERIEKSYNESRSVDSERPLVETDGSRAGDTTVMYDKGGWVFWMMLNHMGRENALDGIRAFISHYSNSKDHPVLQDFVTAMRPFAEDKKAYDDFTRQWFFEVVVPHYKLSNVKSEADGNGKWKVTGTIKNVGTGRIPVEIAASKADRYVDDAREQNEDYRDSRKVVVLGDDESQTFVIECDFEPDSVVIDPDARVLQLNRKLTEVAL